MQDSAPAASSPRTKSWAGDAITATITAFDGSRASGTFEGTFVDNTGGLPPQTFSSGQFSLDMDF